MVNSKNVWQTVCLKDLSLGIHTPIKNRVGCDRRYSLNTLQAGSKDSFGSISKHKTVAYYLVCVEKQ